MDLPKYRFVEAETNLSQLESASSFGDDALLATNYKIKSRFQIIAGGNVSKFHVDVTPAR